MRMTEAELLNYQQRQFKNTSQVKISGSRIQTLSLPQASMTMGVQKPLKTQISSKQTKTEIEYGRMLAYEFPKCEVVPFGITLRLANNHKYTPDYVVKLADGRLLCVEVKQRGKGKNGFRQPSYQRARVMFDQCRVEYPLWVWRWSEKHDGTWSGKDY